MWPTGLKGEVLPGRRWSMPAPLRINVMPLVWTG